MGIDGCAKCEEDREGKHYTFYCGYKKRKFADFSSKKKYISYEIDERIFPFICNKCLQKKIVHYKVYYSFFFSVFSAIILALTYLFSKRLNIWWGWLIGSPIIILSWLCFPKIFPDIGEEAASRIIRIKYTKPFWILSRHKYKNDWDIILTPEEYEEMRAKQTWTSKRVSTELKLFLSIIFIIAFITVALVKS